MICVIPARGGSVRIPYKNLQVFHGKPIIEYSIETALGAGFDTIVSTDDQKIASFAESCGADVHFRHWDDPAGDVGTQEVTKRTLKRLDPDPNEIVMTLYATAPAVTIELVKEAVADFIHVFRKATWVVGSYPHRMDDCGAFYIGRASSYLNEFPLVHHMTVAYPVKGHVDINTHQDWKRYEEVWGE